MSSTEIKPMHDSSLMPFGKYKGRRLIDVPAPYFLWLHHKGCQHEGVRQYINSNLDAIIQEAERIPKR
jgi:uncharacterized protein (DUF3820 family)